MSAAAAEQPPDASDVQPGASDAPASSPPAAQLGAGASSGDKPPGSKRQPSGAQKRKRAAGRGSGAGTGAASGAALNAELKKLEGQLEALLVAPAVPMHMAGDEWAAAHVEGRGPELAHQVVELARRNVAFRLQLQKLLAVNESAQLGLAAASYLLPLLIYYGLLPTPPIVKDQLKVPDRAVARVVVMPDYVPPVGSQDGQDQARAGAFREQPPGTPGSAPAPGAAAPSG